MTRIQIEIDEERLTDYELLMRKCGLRTKKDLINNALTLLEWAVREVEKGNIIASVDEDANKFKEVCLPIFSNLKKVEKSLN